MKRRGGKKEGRTYKDKTIERTDGRKERERKKESKQGNREGHGQKGRNGIR